MPATASLGRRFTAPCSRVVVDRRYSQVASQVSILLRSPFMCAVAAADSCECSSGGRGGFTVSQTVSRDAMYCPAFLAFWRLGRGAQFMLSVIRC
jgi:hypothetical protein